MGSTPTNQPNSHAQVLAFEAYQTIGAPGGTTPPPQHQPVNNTLHSLTTWPQGQYSCHGR